ncbi:hypothetical protein JN11_00012 [Mucilaginibacter frigoritolerans]|jgi:hypothetical protein|uniref:mannosyl-glycoprotein endo-beta-N-acetylglucosaminidase n=1 Tax=Mucilaginibacter frigoritolerans TaxID=652788 RepID=A0A562UEX9_9SPHI|nr:hypothetical protein [Mucilaginibacter frigoritolerans]TWJ04304.1 hypothetical protein JN11_00012 [Mucilaginibacter frigoritolerans]
MKKIFTRERNLLIISFILLLFAACKGPAAKTTTASNSTATSDSALIAYKNSNHHLFLGFLVDDHNDPVASTNPANSPDSVDFLDLFVGYDTTKADWRIAQAKGTKIIRCYFPKYAYFDGSVNDPATKAPGYKNPPGFDQNNPTASSTYFHWAANTYAKDIDTNKWNGIDIDIESGTFGGEVPESNGPNFLTAVAQYYGPNCSKCSVNSGGKKPVFFYDTDGSANDDSMYTPYKSNYDYVDFQSYTTGNHYWDGSGTADFDALVTMYGLNKLIFLVNGDSFVQANGVQVPPGVDSVVTASLYSYATWVKTNNGIGVGAYRMSRDYNHTPHFAVSRNSIQIMNPAK